MNSSVNQSDNENFYAIINAYMSCDILKKTRRWATVLWCHESSKPTDKICYIQQTALKRMERSV